MKFKKSFLVIMVVTLIISLIQISPVKAGGSLGCSFLINNKISSEGYSWNGLLEGFQTFSPMQGDEYEFIAAPDVNTITSLKVIADSDVAEVSEIYEKPAEESYNEGYYYKMADVKIIAEPGTKASITVEWTVQDSYGESRDYDLTFDFTVYDEDTKPYELSSDSITFRGTGNMFNTTPSDFIATQYLVADKAYFDVSDIIIEAFGEDAQFIYFNMQLNDASGQMITEFNDYVEISIYNSYQYDLPKGYKFMVFYVADDGTLTPCVTTYEEGYIKFLTNHLSNYVVVSLDDEALKDYEDVTTEAMTTEPVTTEMVTTADTEEISAVIEQTDEVDSNDSNSSGITVIISIVAVAVVVVCAVVLVTKNKKNK